MSKGYVPKIDVFTAPLAELSEFIIRHLERQGSASVEFVNGGDDFDCLYRGKGIAYDDVPISCAIGCAVSDDFLNRHRKNPSGSYEGQPAYRLFDGEEISENRKMFLSRIQDIHDNSNSWEDYCKGLAEEAKREIRVAAIEHAT